LSLPRNTLMSWCRYSKPFTPSLTWSNKLERLSLKKYFQPDNRLNTFIIDTCKY
jgi:hypothetical protein